MLNVSEVQLGTMHDQLVDTFIASSLEMLRQSEPEFTSTQSDQEVISYIRSCLAFCEDYQISAPSNVHKIMLWNIEYDFLEYTAHGEEILLSEYAYSENYRVQRLHDLLVNKNQMAWRRIDDL